MKSIQNFRKAKEMADSRKESVTMTKKFESIREYNLKEMAKREKKELDAQKEEAMRKEKYQSLKEQFQDRMKNFREQEESRILDHFNAKAEEWEEERSRSRLSMNETRGKKDLLFDEKPE